ncbi:MAG: hypothetical protein II938_03660 [Alphaproteobacteria bacterium]|nr:hypothetical protein [Alphaproteobacteria bacterium]
MADKSVLDRAKGVAKSAWDAVPTREDIKGAIPDSVKRRLKMAWGHVPTREEIEDAVVVRKLRTVVSAAREMNFDDFSEFMIRKLKENGKLATQDLIREIDCQIEKAKTVVDRRKYKALKEILTRQEKAAEELLESGNLYNPRWIREHIGVSASDEAIINEVYDFLNNYVKTPEGRANLAYALVCQTGGADNKMSIKLGTKEELDGAGGWANAGKSHIQLAEIFFKEEKDWTVNFMFPHETTHLGQEDIPDLSQREYFLWHAGIVEADARLNEFCDGVSAGRNPNATGYMESLKDLFNREILPQKEKLFKNANFKTWEEFVKTKDTNPEMYKAVMGRIKEIQFETVLNNLMKTSQYQRQGDCARNEKGRGNLPGLRAWVGAMCQRHGMNFDHIWPMVKDMATGEREIPGMEGGFDAKGRMTKKGRRIGDQARQEMACEMGYYNTENDKDGNRKVGYRYGSRDEYTWYPNGKRTIKRIYNDGRIQEYDNENRLTKETDCSGKTIRTIMYAGPKSDKISRETVVDDNGNVCEHTYGAKGEIFQQIVLSGRKGTEVYRYKYEYENGEAKQKGYECYSLRDNVNVQDLWDHHEHYFLLFPTRVCSINTYDEKGNKISYVSQDADGKVTDIWEYTHDEKGNRTGGVEKDANGKVEWSYEYTYDEKGHRTSEVHKDAKGKVTGSWEYTYDEKGHETSEVHKDAKGKVTEGYGPAYEEALKQQEATEKEAKSKENKEDKPQEHGMAAMDKGKDKNYYGHREGGIDDIMMARSESEYKNMASHQQRRGHKKA